MSTLSSVVSNLVRASMGSSVPSTVADDDLDRHVAELILKEAKQKLEKYNKDGIRAYLPQPETNVPKTNKRFLSSIIRSTDDHNKTILRAQALAAQEVRQERLEQEKRERKARAEEAVGAERMRRLMGRGRVEWAHNRDGGESTERKKRERSWERRDDDGDAESSRKGKERAHRDDREERRSRRHRSSSPVHDKSGSRRRHRHEKAYNRSPSPARSTGSAHDRRRDRREHRRSHHRRLRRSRSPDNSNTSPPRESSKHKQERSHRRHRDRRSRSPDRHTKDALEIESKEALDKSVSPPAESSHHTEEDSHSHSGKERQLEDRSISPSRISRPLSPAQPLQKRKRSPSPFVGPPSPPQTAEIAEGASREEALRRKLKVRLDGAEAGPSSSEIPSRNSTPGYSRASSFKAKEPMETASSSSRTLFSTRTSSPSPAPQSLPPPAVPTPKRSRQRSRTRTKAKEAPPQPPSSPPPLPAHLPSKMDRYFEDSYDPRMDVAPLSVPSIPATGLISDAEFAGWDAMLEVIRQRREDKVEKKRMERLGISDSDSKKKVAEVATEGVDIMAIQYKKRGSVREWDLGKEGF